MKECPVCYRCLEDERQLCPEDGARLDTVFAGPPILDDKYQLLARLGQGGMGRVYRAVHLGLKRLTAVKIPHPGSGGDRRLLESFRREAEALGRLRHANVVHVSDFGVESERRIPYLAMSYLEGRSLAATLREGPLPVYEALSVFEQVAAALDHAHSAGVLHRDLKPGNVFLREPKRARSWRVEVVDFGLSRFFADPEETPALGAEEGHPSGGPHTSRPPMEAARSSDESGASAVMGTPGYVAPEVALGGEATVASDIYSFGALIHATLTSPGLGPGGNGLGAPVDAVVRRALDERPEARPTSARQLVEALRNAVIEVDGRRWRRREAPKRLALAALLGLGGALAIVPLERPLRGFEHRLVDARFRWAPRLRPPADVLLVLIDETTLDASPKPLVEMGDEVGELLHRVLEAGAAVVGIDILLPEHWGRSAAFARLVLRHSNALVLAAFSPPEGPVVGPEVVGGLIAAGLGPSRAADLFGYVNLQPEPDGVIRRARLSLRDVEGGERPAFAAMLAQKLLAQRARSQELRTERTPTVSSPAVVPRSSPPTGGQGYDALAPGTEGPPASPREPRLWIDFTLDWRLFDSLSWRDLAATLEGERERFRDRLVLVGVTYAAAGDGPYRVPHPQGLPDAIEGPVLQAVIASTLLNGAPLQRLGRGWWLTVAGILVGGVAAQGLLRRETRLTNAVIWTLGAGGVWTAAGFILFIQYRWMIGIAPFLAVLVSSVVVVEVLRRGYLAPTAGSGRSAKPRGSHAKGDLSWGKQ